MTRVWILSLPLTKYTFVPIVQTSAYVQRRCTEIVSTPNNCGNMASQSTGHIQPCASTVVLWWLREPRESSTVLLLYYATFVNGLHFSGMTYFLYFKFQLTISPPNYESWQNALNSSSSSNSKTSFSRIPHFLTLSSLFLSCSSPIQNLLVCCVLHFLKCPTPDKLRLNLLLSAGH